MVWIHVPGLQQTTCEVKHISSMADCFCMPVR